MNFTMKEPSTSLNGQNVIVVQPLIWPSIEDSIATRGGIS